MSEDVTRWLEELGLGKYASTFADNDVDIRALPELTEDDLRELNISLGHRRVLLKAISALSKDTPASSSGQSLTAKATSEFDSNLAAWERHPGERKPVTMLFADITGSTALTENLDAEEAHDLLYGATQRMCAAIERNRGTVCRFMGDGVMAMFGAPIASEQHAAEACEAALEMQQAIRDYGASSGTG
jgi:class 3 adenylate cyclase